MCETSVRKNVEYFKICVTISNRYNSIENKAKSQKTVHTVY